MIVMGILLSISIGMIGGFLSLISIHKLADRIDRLDAKLCEHFDGHNEARTPPTYHRGFDDGTGTKLWSENFGQE